VGFSPLPIKGWAIPNQEQNVNQSDDPKYPNKWDDDETIETEAEIVDEGDERSRHRMFRERQGPFGFERVFVYRTQQADPACGCCGCVVAVILLIMGAGFLIGLLF